MISSATVAPPVISTKDISISEDAYEMLDELRGEASYSDMIRRLGRRDDIAQFAEAFPEIGAVADDLEAERKNIESREVKEL